MHELVERLPESGCPVAQRFLEFLIDEADEAPLSAEDWAEVQEGEAAIRRGESTTLDDLKRELNL